MENSTITGYEIKWGPKKVYGFRVLNENIVNFLIINNEQEVINIGKE